MRKVQKLSTLKWFFLLLTNRYHTHTFIDNDTLESQDWFPQVIIYGQRWRLSGQVFEGKHCMKSCGCLRHLSASDRKWKSSLTLHEQLSTCAVHQMKAENVTILKADLARSKNAGIIMYGRFSHDVHLIFRYMHTLL